MTGKQTTGKQYATLADLHTSLNETVEEFEVPGWGLVKMEAVDMPTMRIITSDMERDPDTALPIDLDGFRARTIAASLVQPDLRSEFLATFDEDTGTDKQRASRRAELLDLIVRQPVGIASRLIAVANKLSGLAVPGGTFRGR
jgi:hypothetical protein